MFSTIEQFANLETMTIEEAIGSLKAHEERTQGHWWKLSSYLPRRSGKRKKVVRINYYSQEKNDRSEKKEL